MEYSCKKCGEGISDIAEGMLNGCFVCGSRIFKKSKLVESVETLRAIENITQKENNSDISILVQEKGVYSVNLETLVNRESNSDPIFVQDSKGKINVIFNPDA